MSYFAKSANGFDDLIDKLNITDTSLINFLTDVNQSEKSLTAYKKYLKQTSSATSALSTITAGAGKVMKIFAATAVNALASIVVAKIINEVIEAYDNWVHRIDNAKDTMDASKDAYEASAEELENLKNQAHQAKIKMAEMEKQGLIDDDEYKKLKDTNTELEREIKLLEIRNRMDASKAWDDAEKWFDETKIGGAGRDVSYNELTVGNWYNLGYNNKISDVAIEHNSSNINALLGMYQGLTTKQNENLANIEAEKAALADKSKDEQESSALLIAQYESGNEALQENIIAVYDYMDAYRSGLQSVITAYEDAQATGATLTSEDTQDYNQAVFLLGLIENALNNITGAAQETETAVNKVKEEFNTFDISKATPSQALEKVNSLAEGFDKLKDVYNSIAEDGALDTTKIDEDFTNIFSGAQGYDDFIKTLSESPKDIKKCQSAFNDLVSSWLKSENILDVLNDDTIELISTFLEEQGVVNASEWLHGELEAKKLMVANATVKLTKATADEINAFFDELDASEETKKALARLELAKRTLNGTYIDTSGDIANLIALAEQAGATAKQLARAKSYDKVMSNLDKYGSTVSAEEIQAELEASLKEFDAIIDYRATEIKGSTSNNKYIAPSSSSSNSSSTNKKNTLDWIETKITRCNEQIEKLETKLADLPTRLQKNPHINTIIDEETEKLNILQQAYDEYMKSASESADRNGLKQEYIMKVQNGTIDIEEIHDDSIKNAISEYQDLYNKALSTNVEITATTAKIKELKVQKLDNITNDYDNITSLVGSIYNYKEGLINLKEKAGEEILEKDYTNLIYYQNSIYDANKREYEELLSEFNKLVADGSIPKYSDQWFDYTQQLHETNAELTESQEAIEDLRDSIIELRLKPLQDYKDSLDSLKGSYETLSSLIGDEDLMNGSMITDRGLAQLAIYGQQLGMARQEAEEYSNAIKSVTAMYENGAISLDEYNARIYDLRSSHESAISSVQKYRDAILQFRYDAIQAQIEDMQELTQSRIDDLNQMKKNEDYAKDIADKQKNISALEKKIAVLSLSTNRADIAMRLQLEQELADAREELAETQADHELEKTIEKLEDENEAYEKAKDEELKELKSNLNKQDEIIESYLEKVKDNYDTVYDTLNKYGEAYNLENTDDLTSPWENADSAMNTFVSSLADAVAQINISIKNIDTSKLSELTTMVDDMRNSSGSSGNYKNAGQNWKWQQGQGGKWWYGEEYREDGNYDYASGGIYNIDGKQYKFDNEGYMVTGWHQDSNNTWTYFETDNDNGQMVKSQWRQHSDGKWYYLTHDGTMAKDAVVENRDGDGFYYVDKTGAWDESLGINGLLSEEEAMELGKYRAYKKGVKRVEAEQLAWTQDGGREVIVRKDGGILTQLYPGDGVIPNNMAENLFAWSKYNPSDVFNRDYEHITRLSSSGNCAVVGDIHNEFNITGDADSVLKVVKKYATGPMWDDIKNKTKMYGR